MPITLNFGVGIIMQDLSRILDEINTQSEKIHLVLRGNKLDQDFLGLLPLWEIETLDLSNCQLTDDAISYLMERIKNQAENLPLQALNLSNNTFGLEGAKALAQALPKLNKLQKLNLSSNKQLDDEAVCEIANRLRDKPLKHLDLSFLVISDKTTANAISELSVEHLELNGYQFPPKYLEMIRAAIQKQKGELAATTVFSPENSAEYLKYKADLKIINLARYDNLTVCAKQQQSQTTPDTPNNEPGTVFSTIVQNC